MVADELFDDGARSRIRADADVDAQASVEGLRAASAILGLSGGERAGVAQVDRALSNLIACPVILSWMKPRESNLELTANYQGDRRGSLLSILDCTSTSLGARRLRRWLLYPLLDPRGDRRAS